MAYDNAFERGRHGAPMMFTKKESADVADKLQALMKALTEIAKGEGRYSSDPFTHACNTIDDMKQLALDALAAVSEGKQS